MENFYTLLGFCQSFVEVKRRIQASGDPSEMWCSISRGTQDRRDGMMEQGNDEILECWNNGKSKS
jgi:hypothetical protein